MPASLPHDFLAPGRLWLLVLVVVLAVGYVLLQRRRAAYAVRFTELPLLASVAPRRPGWRRHIPATLLLLTAAFANVAFARPVAEVRVPQEQATIVVAIDTSLSMQATDVDPNRFAAAQAAAARFVTRLPDTFEVGLVSFSGGAAVVVPPTRDHEAVRRSVQTLTLGPSTAIGEAVFASLEAIAASDNPEVPARIVLLTDGTNTVGRSLDEAAAAADNADIPISTISYGTQAGVVEVQGQLIPVPVDREAMQFLAEQTGGTAFTAESGEQLTDVYDDIGEQIGTKLEDREVTDLFAGAALLLGLLAGATALAWTSRLP